MSPPTSPLQRFSWLVAMIPWPVCHAGVSLDGVRLRPPPRKEVGAIRHEPRELEAHEARGEVRRQSFARADEHVPVVIVTLPGRRFPAGSLHLPCLRHGVAVRVVLRVGLGLVVVPAALGGPPGLHPRVEGPVGDVDAPHLLHLAHPREVVRPEPERLQPRTEALVGDLLGDPEGEQALGSDRVRVGRLREDLGRPAEGALGGPLTLADVHGRPALRAADRLDRRAQPALGQAHPVLEGDGADGARGGRSDRLLLAAVLARHGSGRGVPRELRSAAGTGESLGDGVRVGRCHLARSPCDIPLPAHGRAPPSSRTRPAPRRARRWP